MLIGQDVAEIGSELLGFLRRWIDRRCQPVGCEGHKPSVMTPVLQGCWIIKEFQHYGFMVAFQANHLMGAAAFDQQIKNSPRIGPSVNVVAQKNLDRPLRRGSIEITVDHGKQFFKQISPSMDVADGINFNSVRNARLDLLAPKSRNALFQRSIPL